MKGYRNGKVSKLISMLGASVSLAMAPTAAYADGSSGYAQIVRVDIEAVGVFLTVTSSDNPDGCGNGTIVKLDGAADVIDKMLANSLTAASQHLNIRFWLTGCTASPWNYTIPLARAVIVDFQ